MSEWLGVELWPHKRRPARRHVTADIPLLAQQKRSEFGMTHAPGGVLRMPGEVHRPVLVARPAAPVAVLTTREASAAQDAPASRAAQVFAVLLRLAADGARLPSLSEIGTEIGFAQGEHKSINSRVTTALQALHAQGVIVMTVDRSHPRRYPLPRTITLSDGRVLRNAAAG